jgi:hypothetical protein
MLEQCSEGLEAVNALLSVPAFVHAVRQLLDHATPSVLFPTSGGVRGGRTLVMCVCALTAYAPCCVCGLDRSGVVR